MCFRILVGGSHIGFGSASVYVRPMHCGSGLNQSEKEEKKSRKAETKGTTDETKMVSIFTLLKISTENVKSERKEK